MQPTLPALPELHDLGQDPQPAPELRHWYLLPALEAPLDLVDPPLELLPPSEHLALLTRPGAQPAAAYTRVVVDLALLAAQALNRALDADLALELGPPEGQAGEGVGGDVGGLARRAPVGVDDEAARVELLEVDHARGHAARGQRRRRERDGLGLVYAGTLGVREPDVELREGVRGEGAAREGAFGVLFGLGGGGGDAGGDWIGRGQGCGVDGHWHGEEPHRCVFHCSRTWC